MSSHTAIQILANHSQADLMFIKLEDQTNNRFVPKGKHQNVGGCWVPWCMTSDEFLTRCLIIIDRTKGEVIGYIWQAKEGDKDHVRFSKTGWAKASSGNVIAGDSGVGQKINLVVDVNLGVKAEKYE